MLPMGPTETHGTHLPFNVDFLAAEELAVRSSELLMKDGIDTVIATTLPYCLADAAHDYPGNVTLRYGTVADVVEDICTSFAVHGFNNIMVICHHGEPENQEAVIEGSERVKERYDIRVGVSNWFWTGIERFGEILKCEHPEWDLHAGEWETGIIMLRSPDLIDYGILETLEPNWEGEHLAKNREQGAVSMKELGAPDAYLGDPKAATAGTGDRCYRMLAEIVAEEVRELVK